MDAQMRCFLVEKERCADALFSGRKRNRFKICFNIARCLLSAKLIFCSISDGLDAILFSSMLFCENISFF
jgi:hypothetical protein